MSLCRNSDWVWNPPFPRNYCTQKKKKITTRSRPDNREIQIKGGRIREVELYMYFLKIWVVSDKTIQRAFRIHTTLLNKQNPLEKMFIFTMYQNYTLALKFNLKFSNWWIQSMHKSYIVYFVHVHVHVYVYRWMLLSVT